MKERETSASEAAGVGGGLATRQTFITKLRRRENVPPKFGRPEAFVIASRTPRLPEPGAVQLVQFQLPTCAPEVSGALVLAIGVPAGGH